MFDQVFLRVCMWGDVIDRPSTMREELKSGIIHPWTPSSPAVHDNRLAFKACHTDGGECRWKENNSVSVRSVYA